MRMLLMSLLLALGLASMAPATAGQLEDARAAYQAGDYAEALRILRPIAEQGNALAQATLGDMYYLGDGYYEMLLEAPNSFYEALRLQYYYRGKGVPQNYAEAARWYRLAAEQGHARTQVRLGFMYQFGYGVLQNYAEAVKWYRLAAEQGDADAQSSLGFRYQNGEGVPQDNVLAHMWFNLAASKGVAGAAQLRDDVASRMTRNQIAEAQKLAWEWAEAHP